MSIRPRFDAPVLVACLLVAVACASPGAVHRPGEDAPRADPGEPADLATGTDTPDIGPGQDPGPSGFPDVPPAGDAMDIPGPDEPQVPGDTAVPGDLPVPGDTVDPQDAADAPDVPLPPLPTRAAFHEALATQDTGALQAFLDGYDMPVCDAGTCLFVTRVPGATSVSVLGDFDGWTEGAPMAALPGFPGWWWVEAAVDLAPGVVGYKLVVDGDWRLDPSCPYFRFGGYGPDSAVYAPGRGRLARMAGVHSPELSSDRDVFVYLPAAYFADRTARLPVLYLQDGFNVFDNPLAPFGSWHVEPSLEDAVSRGIARPVILVGIDTANRMDEYLWTDLPPGTGYAVSPKLPGYGDFVAKTLKPLVDARFRTRPGREHTGIAGSSLGGISSLWIAWNHPQVFGLAASLSGSFWVGEGDARPSMREILFARSSAVEPGSIRIYLDSGDAGPGGARAYGEDDGWVYTDWVRNALIRLGWQNRPEWDTDGDLSTPPDDLPAGTPVDQVPALAWAAEPPAPYAGWKDWLGTDRDLVTLVAHGHQHNEAAWQQRFPAVLAFLFPAE